MGRVSTVGIKRLGWVAALLLAAAGATACGRESSGQEGGRRDPELERRVEELLSQVADIANLSVERMPAVRRASAETLESYTLERLDAEYPGDTLTNLTRAYQAFGLLPDTVDLRQLLVDVLLEQVVGFYDPSRKTLFLREEVPELLETTVLVHELVHALQDQRVDLDSLLKSSPGNDAKSAAQAAMEGHATLAMFAFQLAQMSGSSISFEAIPEIGPELAGLVADPSLQPQLAQAPAIVREPLVFAYLGGARLVQRLWRTSGERPPPMGEWLPESTEQLLHTEKLLVERDRPTAMELADPQAGWEVLHADGLGELETRIFFEEHTGDKMLAAEAAAGWDGDVYALLSNGSERVLVWYTGWDSEADADEFAVAYRQAFESRFGGGGREGELVAAGRRARVERLAIAGMPAVRVVEGPAGLELTAVPEARLGN